MRADLRMKDNRTFKKHMSKLHELGWVGYNEISGYYFIRSFDYLRFIYTFKKRRASTFLPRDVKHLQKYLVGVILSAKVIGDKYYWEFRKGGVWRTATKKTDVAIHSKVLSETPAYYGMSVKGIAEYLGCKPTRASVVKNVAAKAGYIKVSKKFALYTTLSRADFAARPNLNDLFPHLRGMFRVVPKTVKGVMEYHIMVQCHDEIVPLIKFKTVSKFNNLQISRAIVRYVSNRQQVAAA
jgi:hypothetical protein